MQDSTLSFLKTPIEFLKGVGPSKADLLKKELEIFNYGDLLEHYPFRYVDKTQFTDIIEIRSDSQYVQVRGKFERFELAGNPRRPRLIAIFRDSTAAIEVLWFQGAKWIKDNYQVGVEYVLFGKPNIFRGKVSMPHPEIELAGQRDTAKAGRLQPVYTSTEKLKKRGLDTRGIGKLTKQLCSDLHGMPMPENLPAGLLHKFKLPSRKQALLDIHYPKEQTAVDAAQNRIKFEEFFWIQLDLLKSKVVRQESTPGYLFPDITNHFDKFYHQHLPFELTGAQKRVIREIRQDLLSGKQMNRLLQGDVGSGKTMVALLCMLMAIDNGFQACMMAPTEILAQQHYQGLSELLEGLPIRVGLLTGSVTGADRKNLLAALKHGELHILVGTHALIEKKVVFENLGLAVIDEQHRFGVAQRAKLWAKNTQPPHILVMTATPIPRTLAMTVYGDLDVSVIDELPPGRKPVKTTLMNDSHRLRVFGFMKEQIALGRQVYVIYPLIEESANMDYKDLMDGFEAVCRAFPLPEFKVSIVHGRQKAEDKDYEMARFVKGETQIMVATTVIEVGVNVPNASVMVIESAERFGLSQLHQLRGRVGRGADQSFCILMAGEKLSNDARSRLRIMTETNDGFLVAEHDLKMRGPGDIQGTRQSGDLALKLSDAVRDNHILKAARQEAMVILESDPELERSEHFPVRQYINLYRKESTIWSRIS